MRIGVGRVSTLEQKLDTQQDALTAAGCDRIYVDKISGTKYDRPGLNQALDAARPGDEIVFCTLDRMGRNTLDQLTLAKKIREAGLTLVVLDMDIDFTTVFGELFLVIMSAVAQAEHRLNQERSRLGRAAAGRRGKPSGRPPKLTPRQVLWAYEMRRNNPGMTWEAIADSPELGHVNVKTLQSARKRFPDPQEIES